MLKRQANNVRKPAVAGQFYPADPEKLAEMVRAYTTEPEPGFATGRVFEIMTPHAGYIFSGPTAGRAFARAKDQKPGRVILLGCSHHYRFPKASIITEGAFETPLGRLPIDAEFAEALVEPDWENPLDVHIPEHSLEVELPFIQETFGDVPIVPILFGSAYSEWHEAFAKRVAELASPNDLVVISTDLSHYLTETEANKLDRGSLDLLLTQDVRDVLAGQEAGRFSMCGAPAVAVGMVVALERGARDWQLLDYRTSADASGDTSRVVGYAAVSMERAA